MKRPVVYLLLFLSAFGICAQQTNRFTVTYRQREWQEDSRPIFTQSGDLWGSVVMANPDQYGDAYDLLKNDVVALNLSRLDSNAAARTVKVTDWYSPFEGDNNETVFTYDKNGNLIEENHWSSLGPYSPPWSMRYYYLKDGRKITVTERADSIYGASYRVNVYVPVGSSGYKVASYNIDSCPRSVVEEITRKFHPNKNYPDSSEPFLMHEDYAAIVTNPEYIANGTINLDALGLARPETHMEWDSRSAPEEIGEMDRVTARYDAAALRTDAAGIKKELQRLLDGSRALDAFEADPSAFIPMIMDDTTMDQLSRLYFKLSNKHYAADHVKAMAYLSRAFMFLKGNERHISLPVLYSYGMADLMKGTGPWRKDATALLKANASGSQSSLVQYIVYNYACLAALERLGDPVYAFLLGAKETGFPKFASYIRTDKDLLTMFTEDELAELGNATLEQLGSLIQPWTGSIDIP